MITLPVLVLAAQIAFLASGVSVTANCPGEKPVCCKVGWIR